MACQFIVTATPELVKSALQELTSIDPEGKKVRDLKDGVLLFETELDRPTFVERLRVLDPIFVRHIMPVERQVSLTGQKAVDFPVLLAATDPIALLEPGAPFSVQCRRVGANYDYDSKDVEVLIGRSLEARGARPTFSDTQVQVDEEQAVVSVYLYEDTGYLGFSTVRENLNEHSNEYRVFSRQPRQVSRAEFKLKEALHKFKLDLTHGRALDLGAAPGGWTRVLADLGMEVVAVDPAELDPRVQALPNVTHLKCKAEEYVSEGDFDLLVDDMNVEPEQSAAMLVKMAPHLKPGGYAILTAKLVIRHPDKLLGNIRPVLEQEYDILRIKNLFHNRQEVTVLLRKKSGKGTHVV